MKLKALLFAGSLLAVSQNVKSCDDVVVLGQEDNLELTKEQIVKLVEEAIQPEDCTSEEASARLEELEELMNEEACITDEESECDNTEECLNA